jgi:putative holliday junction resolvase
MGRWLAIDHGTQRIGLAIGSQADGIASPLDVIPGTIPQDILRQLASVIADYDITGLVIGWPLNMDDTEGPQAMSARAFATMLAEHFKLDTRMWDERLSSFQADQTLAGQMTRKKRKARQDAIAAAAFLQDFFSSGGPEGAPRPDEL